MIDALETDGTSEWAAGAIMAHGEASGLCGYPAPADSKSEHRHLQRNTQTGHARVSHSLKCPPLVPLLSSASSCNQSVSARGPALLLLLH